MGSAVSREEVLAIPQAVGLKVKDLGVFLRTIGDEEAGKLLKDICDSPDLPSLRTKLLHEAGRSQQPTEATISNKELELRRFVSSKGKRLSDVEIKHVLCAIGNWIRDGSDTNRQNDLKAWRQNPSIFCTGRPRQSSIEPIAIFFDEYEQIETSRNLNAARRKVLLLNTFIAIRDEERRLRRYKHDKTSSAAKFRTRAIDGLARRVWGHLEADELKRRRRKLARMSTYGEKWNLIQPACMVLSLRGMSKYFEQQKWSELEIEAINTYLQAKLSSTADIQDDAMAAITSEWSHTLHPQSLRSPGHVHQVSTSPSSNESIVGIQSLLDALADNSPLDNARQPATTPGDVEAESQYTNPAHVTETSLLAGNQEGSYGSNDPHPQMLGDSCTPRLFPIVNFITNHQGSAVPTQPRPTESPPGYVSDAFNSPNQINPWTNAMQISYPPQFDPWGNALPVPFPNNVSNWGNPARAQLSNRNNAGDIVQPSTQGPLPVWEDGPTPEYFQEPVTALERLCNGILVPPTHS